MKKNTIFRGLALFGIALLVLFSFSSCDNLANNSGSGSGSSVITDEEILAEAKKNLTLEFSYGESSDKVISDLILPATADNGVSITWTSSEPVLLKITTDSTTASSTQFIGKVEAPIGNFEVTLTATLTKGTKTDTKIFKVTLYGSYNQIVDEAYTKTSVNSLVIQGPGATSTLNFLVGDDVETSWKSSHPDIIPNANHGTTSVIVTKPSSKTEVTLTATIKKSDVERTKEFTVTVYGTNNDPTEILANAKKNLTIQFENGESSDKVLSDIKLDKYKSGGINITWHSSKPAIIEITNEPYKSWMTGRISAPAESTEVTLTATLTKGSETDTKTFTITVYGMNNIIVDNAYLLTAVDPLVIQSSGATDTINLLVSSDVETTWESSDSTIIPNVSNGTTSATVTKPSTKTEVTLTATISKGSAERTKEFTVTVYPDGSEASDADLIKILTLPTEVNSYFALPANISGSTKPITWETSDAEIIEIVENDFGFTGKFAKIKPVIFDDQKATLTATLGSETKTFEVTVKGVKEYTLDSYGGKVEFSENEIITEDVKYSCLEHDKTNKIFRVEGIKQKSVITGEFVNPETYEQDYINYVSKNSKIWSNALTELYGMTSITLQDVKEKFLKPMASVSGKPIPTSDEGIFEDMKSYLRTNIEFDDFKILTPEQKTKVIKKAIDDCRKKQALMWGLNETASWDDISAEMIKLIANDIKDMVEEFKIPTSYKYSIEFSNDGSEVESIRTFAFYNSDINWYKQKGIYNSSEGSIYKAGPNTYMVSINGRRYRGTFNQNFTEFNGENDSNPSDTITATFTDNKDGTITLSVSGGETYTVNFEGEPLFN